MDDHNPSMLDPGDPAGVTLRDLFAGFALAGLLGRDRTDIAKAPELAEYAYVLADAMLAARAPR